ncbi:flagellar basal body rod protein FlgB [Ectobacillus antri]|uniref:Flagellar basal body rod protein FlgB n=1 Tax=Ectobacillus antri TaxID=2486280 RepID=A0ABT6H0U8_9BACI|nr:flagellar basal body rod protein FlgB [Ectobacillus antri]MDG4656192.1 flagellar basal body rod protein FlgB [Ectobacillus antri]MDG5752867.1 flagellar basal body rod protein FlgB [Ectobacillus antri]
MDFVGGISNYMSYLTARRDVISGNISNANTPGYKAKDVKFIERLNEEGAVQQIKRNNALLTTHERHIAVMSQINRPYQIQVGNAKVNQDGNSVDTTKEMIELMKTNHLYSLAVGALNSQKVINQAARGK